MAETKSEAKRRKRLAELKRREFEKLYRDIRRQLPPDLRRGLDARKDQIGTVAELGQAVRAIISQLV